MKKRYRILILGELIVIMMLIVVSITTIITSLKLLDLSYQHGSVDTWRISSMGSAAANNVQELVNQQRQAIYHSNNWVVRYISNLPSGKQELMAFLFSVSPVLAFFLFRQINITINRKLKRRRRGRGRTRIN